MNWEKIKVTNSMTQTMFLDNQIAYGCEAVQNSMKMQSLFFDKLLINRAYFLNNIDLVAIFKNKEYNGFGNLIENGAIAPVMVEGQTAPSFTKEWENSNNQNMAGLNTDKKYAEELDLFFENMTEPASYVSFDYTKASKNYKKLIIKYYNTYNSDILSKVEPEAMKKLKDLLFETNSYEKFTRSILYTEFDIPLRGDDEYEHVWLKPVNKSEISKNVIKEMLDVNYNFNIPHLNNFNFEYINTLPPGCNDEKTLYPIDDLSRMRFEIDLIDFKELSFYDVVNIRKECSDQHKDFINSYEYLKIKYTEENLEKLMLNFREYLNSISNLLRNQKNNKKLGLNRYVIQLKCLLYKCGSRTLISHEIKADKVDGDWEPLFNMVLNIGPSEDESRKTESYLNAKTQNTNDTGIRG